MNIFFEIHQGLPREAPGSNDCTRKAFRMLTDLPEQPQILDIGCGPGMQTIELAHLSSGHVIGLDKHKPFLDELMTRADAANLTDKSSTVVPAIRSRYRCFGSPSVKNPATRSNIKSNQKIFVMFLTKPLLRFSGDPKLTTLSFRIRLPNVAPLIPSNTPAYNKTIIPEKKDQAKNQKNG